MATIADVYRAIHALQSEGVVESYALIGTMAALFYAEATRTFEINVGVHAFQFASLESWAQKQEIERSDQHLIVCGVPVRLIEAQDEMQKSAIANANILSYESVQVRAMNAEVLMAFYEINFKSVWGYCPSYFGDEAPGGHSDDAIRFAAKRRWHQNNARLPIKEKVQQLLELQKRDLPLLIKHRPLKWWEKPWDIEP